MKLTRTNNYVYKKFRKANSIQKQNMLLILKKQLDNLDMLYNMMLKELK